MSTRNLSLILVAILLLAIFVWPGRWKFDKDGEVPMRTNRITGKSELFFGGGWHSLEGEDPDSTESSETTRMFDPSEKSLVTGHGGLSDVGFVTGALYNGTSCTVSRIVYRIVAHDGPDTSTRVFSESEHIPSRQTEDIIFRAYSAGNHKLVSWGIDSVEGRCPTVPTR